MSENDPENVLIQQSGGIQISPSSGAPKPISQDIDGVQTAEDKIVGGVISDGSGEHSHDSGTRADIYGKNDENVFNLFDMENPFTLQK